MPWASDRQRRWAHTKTGLKKMGKKTVEEFDRASKGKKLPEKAKKRKKGK
jgi:hypothetical protein